GKQHRSNQDYKDACSADSSTCEYLSDRFPSHATAHKCDKKSGERPKRTSFGWGEYPEKNTAYHSADQQRQWPDFLQCVKFLIPRICLIECSGVDGVLLHPNHDHGYIDQSRQDSWYDCCHEELAH